MNRLLTFLLVLAALFQSAQTGENNRKPAGFPDAFIVIKTIAELSIDEETFFDRIPYSESDVLNQTFMGWTPLSMALYRGFPHIAEALLRRGATVENALKCAIDHDFVEALAAVLPLIGPSIDDYWITPHGDTVITYAQRHNKPACLKYINAYVNHI